MNLSGLEHLVASYYVAGPARDLVVAPRWYPHGELILIIEDKMTVAIRKFGRKARSAAKAASTGFVDHMIEKGAWASKENDFGGMMHQFQPDAFKAEIRALQDSDPLIQKAQAEGPEFWEKAFSELTDQPAG